MDHALGVLSEKSSPHTRLFRFFPMLSSKIFIVLHFTLKPIIYFDNFCKTSKIYVYTDFFFFLPVDVHLL